jgi:hypothetical protein
LLHGRKVLNLEGLEEINIMDEQEKTLITKLNDKIDKLAAHFEKATIQDYMKIVGNPWKVIGMNLMAGIMRGFGLAIGATIILAVIMIILTKVLSQLITLPLVGQQIAQLVEMVNGYMKEGTKIKIDSGGAF